MTARPAGSPATPGADQALSPADGLAQLSFLIQAILERRAREHDLSITQVRLLGVLRDRTPAMNELAKLLDLDKSSITGLIDRAQRRGIVTRVPSTTDRRAVLVALTAHGRSLAATGTAHFEADAAQLLSFLPPPDRQALSQLISKLLITHATDQGIDLFATTDTGGPGAGPAP
jgi:MarR family transcriptional regulator, lower aerobic nicotinate degradation pathway regulator